MAHIVGVPKREPCKHCGLPVFFAERLAVDGSFYHRKCLRCARCDSQLTPGSFYETEVDGVFCCETCPDEEKKMRHVNNNAPEITEHTSRVADEQRQSFSEKLAMFQTNGKGLLQKSLSDEEKSKSLKRLTELYSKNGMNDVKQTINETEDVQIDKSDYDIEHSSSESSEDEEDVPPLLPKSLPPSLNTATSTEHNESKPKIEATKPKLPPIPSKANVLNKIYGKKGIENRISMNAIATRPRLQTQNSAEPSIVVNEDELLSQKQSENCANDEHQSETPHTPATDDAAQPQNNDDTLQNNLNTNNRLPLDALNSFTNVTKENADENEASQQQQQHPANVHRYEDKSDSNDIDDDTNDKDDNINIERDANGKNAIQLESLDMSMETEHSSKCEQNEENQEQLQEQKIQQEHSISGDDCNVNKSIDMDIDKYDTNKLDNITDLREPSSSISENESQQMVRSRLSQFEALVQSPDQMTHHSPRLNRSSVAAVHSEQSKPAIVVNEMANIDDASPAMQHLNVDNEMPVNRLSLNADDEEKSVSLNASINADSDKILNTLETNNLDVKKPVPRQRASVNICLDNNDGNLPTNAPTPTKRKQKSTASDGMANKQQMAENNLNSLDSNDTTLPEISLSSEENEQKKDETKYPNGLNPFGSDDEDDDEDEQRDSFEPNIRRKESLNPFDSSDDEIELLKETPNKRATTTTNHNR